MLEPFQIVFLLAGIAFVAACILVTLLLSTPDTKISAKRKDERVSVGTAFSVPNLSRLSHFTIARAGYTSIGSAVPIGKYEIDVDVPDSPTPCYRQKSSRRIIAVSSAVILVACIAASAYFLNNEGNKVVGVHGFEWTERYATVMQCGGINMMSTRMRYLGAGKYVTVIRRQNDNEARALWQRPEVGYNPTIFCKDGEPYLIGSANVETHINFMAEKPAQGRIHIMNLNTHRMFEAGVNMSSCIDKMFPGCGLDSKFSVIWWKNAWVAYIRANPVSGGGGRHVQLMTSTDGTQTWSPFRLVDIDNVTPAKGSDIYFFDVFELNSTHMGAHYPAVFDWESGVFESTSTDGVHWSAPELLRHSRSYGERTTLHPVGSSAAMRINLHIHTADVALYYLYSNGSTELDNSFYTPGTSFPSLESFRDAGR